MKHRLFLAIVVLAATLFAACGFGVPGATAATGQCDSYVYDGAGLFGDQTAAVEAAAQKLVESGVDVRAFTQKSLGGYSTLDKLVEARQKMCESWRGPTGARKNNLLVFGMSLDDRKVGIFFGEKWEKAFRNEREVPIWSETMGSQFRDGNFAGGFIDAMDEAGEVIDNYLHPEAPKLEPAGEPTDLSGLWWILGVILGLGALGAAIAFGGRAYRRHKAREEERRGMRQRALRARDAASAILNPLGTEENQAIREAKVKTYSVVGGERATQLQAALEDFEANYEAATSAHASAASASATAGDEDLTTTEYEQMALRYEEALEAAEVAEKADDQINDLANEIKAEHQRMSDGIMTLQTGLDELASSVEQLKKAGIKADPIDRHIKDGTIKLNSARENQADLSALAVLGEAGDEFDRGQRALELLNNQRQQLAEGIPALKARIPAVQAKLGEARQCFERISSTYAESSWEAVRGNGTEAEKRLERAATVLETARSLSDISEQKWKEALTTLQAGNELLDKAESLLRSITELEKNLHKAQKQSPREIEDAASDIAKAANYIETYDGDIDEGLERDLRKAEKILEVAREELRKELPDYLLVMKLATQANSAADSIYAEAAEEHEAAERLRRQAASALIQAEAAVSQAEEYIQDHSSDVGGDAEASLSNARFSLDHARATDRADKVLWHANNALTYAEQAYESAKSDFTEAEDSRARARRRRQDSDSFGGGSYGGGFGGWGSSGGGFSSGGGSSGGFSLGGGGGGGSSGGW